MSLRTIYGLTSKGKHTSTPALDTYIAALLCFARNTVEIEQQAAGELRSGMQALVCTLQSDSSHPALQASLSTVDCLLKQYRDATLAHHNGREVEVREILSVLGSAAQSLAVYGEQRSSQLRSFMEELNAALQLQELGEVRRAITKQVQELRVASDALERENQRSASHYESRLAGFQERLDRAEQLAATDELSGLVNRREGLARLRQRIDRGSKFCLMILDLDRFKAINDQHGHTAGDEVLRAFATRLAGLFRSGDVVCRWGGDEFLVLIDLPGGAANDRPAQVRSQIGAIYPIKVSGKTVELRVNASLGSADFCPGETAESLFARADEDLYRQKRWQQPPTEAKELAG